MKTPFKKYYLLLLALILISTASCQTQSSSRNDSEDSTQKLSFNTLGKKMDFFLLEKMKKEHLPGLAVVVVKDGEVIYKQGYGVANVESGERVNPDSTIFRIGSVSKALTMLCLTKLVDQGKLSYEDNVTNYFGDIHNPFQLADTLRIKHVLTHTGGFEQFGIQRQVLDFDLPLDQRKAKRPSIEEFAKNNLRRIRPAGQHFTYDTYGTTLAGVLIEKATKLSYPQAMKELLFDPLGMNLSSVEVERKNKHLLAKGYGYDNDKYKVMPYEVYKTYPASSIDATVSDMGKLLQAMTGEGSNEDGKLFSKSMMERMLAPQFKPHPEFVGMTHGFWEGNVFGSRPTAFNVRTIGHGGTMLGLSSNLIVAPELNLGAFIVTNRDTEAGGGNVSIWEVFNVIFAHFKVEKAPLFDIPNENENLDLSDYSGNYYNGLFCHTCTEADFDKGAWQRPSTIEITIKNSNIIKGEHLYIYRGEDIFVREDGKEMLFFGRDEYNEIIFYVSSEDATTFERIN